MSDAPATDAPATTTPATTTPATVTPSSDQKLLGELREVVKKLPLNERKQAAALFSIFEQIVENNVAEEKENDASYKKYSKAVQEITTAMDQIIEGKRKVTDEEVAYWKDTVDAGYTPDQATNTEAPIKGFWRKFIENSGLYHGEQDLPILDHLVHVEISDENDKADQSITYTVLTLDFSPNKYFTNEKLTTKLFQKDGEMTKSEGTVIQWTENPTVKKTTKSQKNKRTGQNRIITKETQLKSFFEIFGNFSTEDQDEKDEHHHGKDEECNDPTMTIWELSDMLAQINDIIPYALEYYLGVVEDDDHDDDDLEGEEDNDEEDDDSDADDKRPRYKAKKGGKEDAKKDSKKASRKESEAEKKGDEKPKDGQADAKNPECKQQ